MKTKVAPRKGSPAAKLGKKKKAGGQIVKQYSVQEMAWLAERVVFGRPLFSPSSGDRWVMETDFELSQKAPMACGASGQGRGVGSD
jgi:hypothetical protein